MHSTYNIDDGYLGSGTNLKESILQYGANNHIRKILFSTDTRLQLQKKEKEIVCSHLIRDPLCMNIMPGGKGGFPYENRPDLHKKFYMAGNDAFKKRIATDPELRKRYQGYAKDALRKAIKRGTLKTPDWNGRKHSKETKIKIGEKTKIHQLGKGNSQYGTMWITNEIISKKIKKGSRIPNNWRAGRVMKFIK